MLFQFSDEQVMLTQLVEKYTNDHYDVVKRSLYLKEPQGFSQKNWDILAKTGVLAAPLSEESGGLGGRAGDLISVMQPLGRAVSVEPILSCAVFASHFLDNNGTPEQRKTLLPKFAEGSLQLAIAHSERNARYDLGYVTTTYSETSDGYVINGHKTFVLGAGAADTFIVSAIAEGESCDDKSNIKFFIVDGLTSEFSKRTYRLVDGSCLLYTSPSPRDA